jgi:hypothetical protein
VGGQPNVMVEQHFHTAAGDKPYERQRYRGAINQAKESQTEFVNLIVDQITEHGVMPASLLYESPFTDVSSRCPDGLLTSAQMAQFLELLARARATAVAA